MYGRYRPRIQSSIAKPSAIRQSLRRNLIAEGYIQADESPIGMQSPETRGRNPHRAGLALRKARRPGSGRLPGEPGREGPRERLGAVYDRMQKFGLELHPEKTRLIEFGHFAAKTRAGRGERKPETFAFLGFTRYCCRSRQGQFMVLRSTMAKRQHAKLRESMSYCVSSFTPSPAHPRTGRVVGIGLSRVLRLSRCSREHPEAWPVPHTSGTPVAGIATPPGPEAPNRLGADGRLGEPLAATSANLSSVALEPFRRSNPRQEPSAVILHARICAGAGSNPGPYRDR